MLPPLATADDVEAILGRTLTDDESTRVDRQLELASSRARQVARQTISLVTDDVVELESVGHGGIWLPERPVVAVTALELNGVALAGSAYTWTDGMLNRVGYPGWGWPSAALRVTYTHGYAEDDDVTIQVATIVASLVADRIKGGPDGDDRVTAESIGNWSESREATPRGSFPLSDDDRTFLKSLRPPILSVPVVTDSAWCPTDRALIAEDPLWPSDAY